jgi:cytidylate kinase
MRGNITKRGKNSWQLKFDVSARDGKDAHKELTRLLNAADAGTLPDPTRVTVAEYVRTWLAGAHQTGAEKHWSATPNWPRGRSSPTSGPSCY